MTLFLKILLLSADYGLQWTYGPSSLDIHRPPLHHRAKVLTFLCIFSCISVLDGLYVHYAFHTVVFHIHHIVY
jgi:glucose-6-phosphate-specific signal transduction histidine kinase